MKNLILTLLILMFANITFAQTKDKKMPLFWVMENGKYGYIDKTGKMVIEAKFAEAKEFSGGVAQVETDGKQHHWIDENGKILWSQQMSKEKSDVKDKH